ncbi:hypothetical protein OG361_38685 [Streptomyces sp. NBC_00090]|uniref:hypothetical protein n=1 Tax=Streptomyces sp. NBC_00090 TaxID=2903619 RepID=UPI003245C58B
MTTRETWTVDRLHHTLPHSASRQQLLTGEEGGAAEVHGCHAAGHHRGLVSGADRLHWNE